MLVTGTVRNVQDQNQHVLHVKEVCIFTILNAFQFALNQLFKAGQFAQIAMQHVLNAPQQ